MAVQRAHALAPHHTAVFVAEEQPTLEQVLVIRIDSAADMTGGADPRSRFDVDLLADETELRAAVVHLDERALGLVVVDRLFRVARERSELEEQRPDLR